jgi:hypothetical protein
MSFLFNVSLLTELCGVGDYLTRGLSPAAAGFAPRATDVTLLAEFRTYIKLTGKMHGGEL